MLFILCLAETCCSFMFEIWDFIWWCILRHGYWDFILLLRYFVWCFSGANFYKHSFVCFEIIEEVASKLFWIISMICCIKGFMVLHFILKKINQLLIDYIWIYSFSWSRCITMFCFVQTNVLFLIQIKYFHYIQRFNLKF